MKFKKNTKYTRRAVVLACNYNVPDVLNII